MNKIFFFAAVLFLYAQPERASAQTPLSSAAALSAKVLKEEEAKETTASIFFETDKSELSAEARLSLDELAPALLNAPDYKVNIEAFTDDRGTEQYNLRLAADRATSVQNYLAAKGLIADKTSVQNWGEKKAASTTELGRQKSRRVDVLVNSFFFNDFKTLRERLSANTEQVLKIRPDQEQSITAARGTQVIVPANAFVFADGTAPTSEVDMTIQEAFDPSDFVLHNLTTMSDGRILQTGGMVSITAQSGGRELRLANGASLTVSIPNGGSFDPSMELFYAQSEPDGDINWNPAGQNFRQTQRIGRVKLTIDPALGQRIAALKVAEYPKPALPVFKGQMPPEPKMPSAPYKPRPPKKPEWNQAQRIFGGGSGEMTRMSKKELKKAQKYFNEQMKLYERDSAKYVRLEQRYRRNVEGFEKSKARIAQEHLAWERELKTRLQAILLYKREMRLHFYSKSLPKALKVTAKTIQQYGTYSNLYWAVETEADKQTQFLLLGSGFSIDTRKSVRETGNLYESIIGLKTMDTYPNYTDVHWSVQNSLPTDTSFRVMRRMLGATDLEAISDSLQAEIEKKKVAFSSKSIEQLNAKMDGYIADVTQLGWVNCDRFYNESGQRREVVIREAEEATLYVVCKDINAIVPFNRNDDGSYSSVALPKGRKITVVAIKLKDGMPQYAQRDMMVGDAAATTLAYKSLPLRDLKQELKKLNI